MLVDPAAPCLCQSGRLATDCCFPAEPPILQSEPRITGANVQAELSAPGIGSLPWPRGWKPFVSLNQPGQVDAEIENIAMGFLRAGAPRGIDDPHELIEALRPLSTSVSRLAEAIYAARYHQLQFLFRLRRVFVQQTFAFTPPCGNAVVRLNDRPLQAELEAFLIRLSSTLDAMAKTLCILGKWSERHGSFTNLLKYLPNVSRRQVSAEARLLKVLRQHETWAREVKQLRNVVAHEGTTDQFVPVSHEGMLVHDAKVAGVRAGEFAVRTWRSVKELTSQVALTFEPTSDPGRIA